MFVDFSRSHIERWSRESIEWTSDGTTVRIPHELVIEVADLDSDQEPTGQVVLSVESLRVLLADGGWERA